MVQKVPAVMALDQGSIPGSVLRTQYSKNRDVVSLFDFLSPEQIADVQSGVTPTWDATPYFNMATSATLPFTGNEDAPKRLINIPAGNWRLLGTVYVRKGQTLQGAGIGVTRIVRPGTSVGIGFMMGNGLIAGVATPDPGGLPPVVRNFHVEGGNGVDPTVYTDAAGAEIDSLFLTSIAAGIYAGGGDVLISNCFFDQGQNGIILTNCQNVVITGCLFYLLNYQISVGTGVKDCQVNGCHFEYSMICSVLFQAGASIKNFSVDGCQFLLNEQFVGFLGFVNIQTGDIDAHISNCEFRNMAGPAIFHSTQLNGVFVFNNCIFDGNKTNSVYDQSTTAAALWTDNEFMRLIGCVFRNLHQSPIRVGGALVTTLELEGCTYYNNAGATFINNINTHASLRISVMNTIGDGVQPLINIQAVPQTINLKGNLYWLGAAQVAGGRNYWKIPANSATLARVTLTANTQAGGNVEYRKVNQILAVRHVDYNGAALADFAKNVPVYAAPDESGFVPLMDVQVALDAVGGPASSPYAGHGRWLVVSIPQANYSNIGIHADIENL